MNDRVQLPAQLLLNLGALRDKALAADTLNTLAFSMANDLYPLLQFRQALVLAQRDESFELLCVSGLAKPQEDSPYLVWLRRSARWLAKQLNGNEPQWLSRDAVKPPAEVADGWAEWWPTGVWCVRCKAATASAWVCSCSSWMRRRWSPCNPCCRASGRPGPIAGPP